MVNYHSKNQSIDIPEVAVLVDTSTAWGRRVVRGIQSYVDEVGPWDVWIRESGRAQEYTLPKGWSGDGVIARVSNNEMADMLSGKGLPLVNVSETPINELKAPRVTTDNVQSAQMAVEHLINRGYRNFGYVGPICEPHVAEHHQVFEDVLKSYGFACDTHIVPAGILEGDHSAAVQDALSKWLSTLITPIAVYSWGASLGRDVLTACLKQGVAVPSDVAVLGGDFDDLLNEGCHPKLSGIVAPAEQVGYEAARQLHQMMEGATIPVDTTYLPPLRIEERMSTDMAAVGDTKLVQVIDYLRKHAFGQIKMDDVLNAVPMSRRSLERRFQKTFGCTIFDEVRRLRICKARKLLLETDMKMPELAEACGFTQYTYFSSVFKEVQGEAPRDYRNRWRVKAC